MENSKKLILSDIENYSAEEITEIVASYSNWEDLLNIGQLIHSLDNHQLDHITLEVLEKAYTYGLNINSNPDKFLEALYITSKLYLYYNDYDNAMNHLKIIADSYENLPNWVHLDYATMQIHSSYTFASLVKKPPYLIKRLNKISNYTDQDSLRRSNIFDQFLYRLDTHVKPEFLTKENGTEIIQAAINYRLNNSQYLHSLNAKFGLNYEIPALDNQEENIKLFGILKKLVADRNLQDEKIKELEGEIKYLKEELNSLQIDAEEIESQKAEIARIISEHFESIQELAEQDTMSKDAPKEFIGYKYDESKQIIDSQESTSIANIHPRYKKLLIVGESSVKKNEIIGIAKEFGFNKNDLDVELDYDKASTIVGRIKQYESNYAGIIAGAMPHKTKNNAGYTSFINKLENEPEGYPHLEQTRNHSNELKMTKTSLREAFKRMASHLQANQG